MNDIDINTSFGAAVLSSLPIFAGLTEAEFEIIRKLMIPIEIKNGESVVKEGEDGEEMYIFFSGALNAYGAQSDGTQKMLFEVKLGDFFGEMSIIANEPRMATITAIKDSIVIMLSKTNFYRIINEYPETGFKMLKAICNVQNRWLNQSSKSYSDLIRWGENARRRAITDELTGLYNNRFLEESIKEYFNSQTVNMRIMSLLMLDLDKIHGINDKYGTKTGDLVIAVAAGVIRSCLRTGDIPARLSGDEFAILLPDTDRIDAAVIAEQIRMKIENRKIEVPACPGANETVLINTRTSIGISITPVFANTAADLFNTSDTALRKAKELGRNRVEIFS